MDLDGDGHDDILSGSWPGELFLFRGGPDGAFAAPEMLKNRDGNYINIGGGIEETEDQLLITGNADFVLEDGKHVIMYHGKRLEIPKGKQGAITGTASATYAADWDADGDLDLLVGDIGGAIYLLPNERTNDASSGYAFGDEQRLQAGGKDLRVPGGDAGPVAADWDADGDLDLVVGCGDGSVTLFRNTGTRDAPELAAAETLIPAGRTGYGANAPVEVTRGVRAKVCVVDWNLDGHFDLLVGDMAEQRVDMSQFSDDELAKHAEIRAEIKELNRSYSKVSRQLRGRDKVTDPDEKKKLQAESSKIYEQLRKLRAEVPAESDTHGWVWLFLREPTGDD